jgi:hypothetical protein
MDRLSHQGTNTLPCSFLMKDAMKNNCNSHMAGSADSKGQALLPDQINGPLMKLANGPETIEIATFHRGRDPRHPDVVKVANNPEAIETALNKMTEEYLKKEALRTPKAHNKTLLKIEAALIFTGIGAAPGLFSSTCNPLTAVIGGALGFGICIYSMWKGGLL